MVSGKKVFQLLLIVGLVGVQPAGAMDRIAKEKKAKEAQLQAVRDRIARQKEERRKKAMQAKISKEVDQDAAVIKTTTTTSTTSSSSTSSQERNEQMKEIKIFELCPSSRALVPVSSVNKKEEKGKEKIEEEDEEHVEESIENDAPEHCGTLEIFSHEILLFILGYAIDESSSLTFFKSAYSMRLLCKFIKKIIDQEWLENPTFLKALVQKLNLLKDDMRCQSPLELAIITNRIADAYLLALPNVELIDDNQKLRLFSLACNGDNAEIAQILIDRGVKVNSLWNNRAILSYAVFVKALKVVKVLLERGAITSSIDWLERTPFTFAFDTNNLEIIKLLIAYADNVDWSNRWGETPLSRACDNNNPQIVLYLLQHGARNFPEKYISKRYDQDIETMLEEYGIPRKSY